MIYWNSKSQTVGCVRVCVLYCTVVYLPSGYSDISSPHPPVSLHLVDPLNQIQARVVVSLEQHLGRDEVM